MEKVTVLPAEKLINGWIDPSYLPAGKDKYYIRNRQVRAPKGGWRHLNSDEIEQLVRNANTASSWDTIWVTDEFEPTFIVNNPFRRATYRSDEEMTAAIGTLEENGFIRQINAETAENLNRLEQLRTRI